MKLSTLDHCGGSLVSAHDLKETTSDYSTSTDEMVGSCSFNSHASSDVIQSDNKNVFSNIEGLALQTGILDAEEEVCIDHNIEAVSTVRVRESMDASQSSSSSRIISMVVTSAPSTARTREANKRPADSNISRKTIPTKLLHKKKVTA
ncbi:unnamed protein product [Linum trigynum]|uniref:Uncharacterized protein n=1 Tax=Linum trigynum TaxID=586398 RepID=A0AAV2CU12_9ROSI